MDSIVLLLTDQRAILFLFFLLLLSVRDECVVLRRGDCAASSAVGGNAYD